VQATSPETRTSGVAQVNTQPFEEFRLPRGPGLLSLFVTVFVGLVSTFLFVIAIWLFTQHWGAGPLRGRDCVLLRGADRLWLARLPREMGLRVAFDHDTVTLDLPAGRSLIHRVPAQRLTIPCADIAAIETRLEAYRSLGMVNMQRAYALRGKSDDWVFLFEDRALGTAVATSFFASVDPIAGAWGVLPNLC
jgi:hypothetical protein